VQAAKRNISPNRFRSTNELQPSSPGIVRGSGVTIGRCAESCLALGPVCTLFALDATNGCLHGLLISSALMTQSCDMTASSGKVYVLRS